MSTLGARCYNLRERRPCRHRTRAMNPDYRPTAEAAEAAYARNHASAMRLLELVREGLENAPAPEDNVQINWAHVGSLSHVNDQLREIVRFLNDEDCPIA